MNLVTRLQEAESAFSNTRYQTTVEKAWETYNSGNTATAENLLNTLPTKEMLLRALVEKLKGKPVYKTFKRISEGKVDDPIQAMKGLFSLGTHVLIECEKKLEYRMLLPMLHERIGELMYEVV